MENLGHQTWANSFTTMDWHNGMPPVGMAQKVMAAFDTNHLKPGFAKRRNESLARDARQFGHASTTTR
jgi:hypothetical protein